MTNPIQLNFALIMKNRFSFSRCKRLNGIKKSNPSLEVEVEGERESCKMSDRKEIRVIGYLHISRYNICWSALHRNMLEIQSPIFR